MAWRRMRVGAAGLVLVVGLAACDDNWRQMGFGPEGHQWNAAEETITPENVEALEERWSTDYGTFEGDPIVDAGKVFVVDNDNDNAGVARALDVDTGEVLWDEDIGSFRANQPVLVGGQLNVHESTARGGAVGTTVAFDVDGCAASPCTPLWFAAASPTASGIAVAEGHLFVATDGSLRVYAPGAP